MDQVQSEKASDICPHGLHRQRAYCGECVAAELDAAIMGKPEPGCANCRFWVRSVDEDREIVKFGHCRRYAPRPAWPQTYQHQSCGEWESNGVDLPASPPKLPIEQMATILVRTLAGELLRAAGILEQAAAWVSDPSQVGGGNRAHRLRQAAGSLRTTAEGYR